jgi:D-alanyl-D-alanine carboxypeptidase (penicillin-binding protein 5/6)
MRRGLLATVIVSVASAVAPLLTTPAIATAPAAANPHCASGVTPTTTTTTTSPTSTTTSTSTSTTTTMIPPTTTTTSADSTTTVPSTTTTTVARESAPAWPKQGSGAVVIPQLCVAASSPFQPVVAIASLTKMMTAWVVLHRLPLAYSQRGPCLTVTASDVAAYDYDVASGQSNAKIVLGERLCEGMLLRGLLVHSAGDFAQLLQKLTGYSSATFVRVMNRDASSMGLAHTNYVDLTGISPADRSTAREQAILAVALMANEPIVDRIVALPRVALPFAGVIGSYTPFVGVGGVVGVKSGFTNLAGGCDVMAVNVSVGRASVLAYAVILGQNGSDPLAIAGNAALALAHSMRPSMKSVVTPSGVLVKWVGSPGFVVTPTTSY